MGPQHPQGHPVGFLPPGHRGSATRPRRDSTAQGCPPAHNPPKRRRHSCCKQLVLAEGERFERRLPREVTARLRFGEQKAAGGRQRGRVARICPE